MRLRRLHAVTKAPLKIYCALVARSENMLFSSQKARQEMSFKSCASASSAIRPDFTGFTRQQAVRPGGNHTAPFLL
jgi:hypothetical protein